MKDLLVVTAALGAIASAPAAAEPGRLVIVGGALEDDNAAVFEAFLEDVFESETARIAVISAASGSPASSAQHMVEVFGAYGVPANRVDIVRLAVRDDDTTPDVDESAWSGNAVDAEEIAKIERAGAVWFTGGDQVRLTTTLLTEDGSDTPMLAALRTRLEDGATLGGTSAGAAIMSGGMIARGDSLTALVEAPLTGSPDASRMEGGQLFVQAGLGFFPYGMIDQHFDRRARLGRLARSIALTPVQHGFGIDEDTGLVVDLATHRLSAVGTGSVTWLDAAGAEFADVHGRFRATDLQISILSGGDALALGEGEIQVTDYKAATVDNEYFDHLPAGGGGIAVSNHRVDTVLGEELVDNSASARLDRVSFRADGRGVLYRFTQHADSAGYWGRDTDGQERYTILNVQFDILPADIAVDLVTE